MKPVHTLLAALAYCLTACLAGPGEKPTMTSYNPIIETMQAQLIEPAAVSSFGTVPGLLTIPGSAFQAANPQFVGMSGLYKFDIRDCPAIKQVAVFSSLADGLAPQKGTDEDGRAAVRVSWRAYDAADVAVATLASFTVYLNTFNAYFEYDAFPIFSSSEVRTAWLDAIQNGAVYTRLDFDPPLGEQEWTLAAYSMSSGWNAALLSLYAHVVVSHTFPLVTP